MSIEILPKRKVLRLSGFDYGGTSAYFVTICTENKLKILSDIVGEGSPLPHPCLYRYAGKKTSIIGFVHSLFSLPL